MLLLVHKSLQTHRLIINVESWLLYFVILVTLDDIILEAELTQGFWAELSYKGTSTSLRAYSRGMIFVAKESCLQ